MQFIGRNGDTAYGHSHFDKKNKETKSGEAKKRATRKNPSDSAYYQQDLYNDDAIDQEILRESNSRHSESKSIFPVLLITIFGIIFFGSIIKSCPAQKEPDRPPSPRVEYQLPKEEGSSITVNSDILTSYFGISYEQRQSSNLFMKDSYEYRYIGDRMWTITKKGAVNNTNRNYIDTNSKNEVENYLHGLGF